MNDRFEAFQQLSSSTLENLAQACCSGPSNQPPSMYQVQQVVGQTLGSEIAEQLRVLIDTGWSRQQLAIMFRTICKTRELPNRNNSFDLVLSGPDVSGSPTRDTQAVMHSLLSEAQFEVLLVGYVIHNAAPLLEPLARKMKSNSSLNVWCCLDVNRGRNETATSEELRQIFKSDFETRLWPWEPRPRVYFDPRSLGPWGAHRSSLHAKCIVVDRKASLITSANFTDAAQHRNIEAGVLSRDPQFATRLQAYFLGLRESSQLIEL
jgi:hypothetical protein